MTTAPVSPTDLAGSLSSARVIDLSHPLEASTPHSPHHAPFRMALLRRHGDAVREGGLSGANELISMGAHTATHIDALSHISLDGHLHRGHDAAEAQRGGRFQVLGAETIKPLLGRGVLLDVAAHHSNGTGTATTRTRSGSPPAEPWQAAASRDS
jgi:hypothetical protein